MVRSFSKRARRTHWWNLISSNSTAFIREVDRPVASNMSLSFKPSLSSGIPDRNDFIWITPMISEWRTVPLLDTRRLSRSMTSRNISFLRCLMPSDRHETALVRATGGRGAASSLLLSWVITLVIRIITQSHEEKRINHSYSRRILDSQVCGYPKSIVSSNNSYTTTKLSRIDSSSSSPK